MKIFACFTKQSTLLFLAQLRKLCGSLYHFSLYENICFFYKNKLACLQWAHSSYVVYADAHSNEHEHVSYLVACIVFLEMKLFV
jgi:hypothetical protein